MSVADVVDVDADVPATVRASVRRVCERSAAREMVEGVLCPPGEERDRCAAGMEAYGSPDVRGGVVVDNDDPRGRYTYGEFPFESFDALVDLASNLSRGERKRGGDRRCSMVDLGSGCGRLVFYAALTRGGEGSWDFHGVEIGARLHALAAGSLRRGAERGWFEELRRGTETGRETGDPPTVGLHNGNALLAEDPYYADARASDPAIEALLSRADVLFAYSTVWETDPVRPFDPEMGAMVLSPGWSRTLASLCPDGCVAVTTDRALNPSDGWRLLHRMDVENPSVWGSTGYISVLEKDEE